MLTNTNAWTWSTHTKILHLNTSLTFSQRTCTMSQWWELKSNRSSSQKVTNWSSSNSINRNRLAHVLCVEIEQVGSTMVCWAVMVAEGFLNEAFGKWNNLVEEWGCKRETLILSFFFFYFKVATWIIFVKNLINALLMLVVAISVKRVDWRSAWKLKWTKMVSLSILFKTECK